MKKNLKKYSKKSPPELDLTDHEEVKDDLEVKSFLLQNRCSF